MSGVLRPDAWQWQCHWPGCDLSTRGAGPFCYGHYTRLTRCQQDAAAEAMAAYRAELAAAVNAAAEEVRAEHADRYRALGRDCAPSPVTAARDALAARRGVNSV